MIFNKFTTFIKKSIIIIIIIIIGVIFPVIIAQLVHSDADE